MAEDTELRKTKQRKKLLDILKSKPEPLTAEQILKICQRDCPNIALTTVYRNLDRMTEMGVATKIANTGGAARFTVVKSKKKIVLYCRMCQTRFEISDVPFDELAAKIEERSGFSIEHQYLEFYGLCPKCRNKVVK